MKYRRGRDRGGVCRRGEERGGGRIRNTFFFLFTLTVFEFCAFLFFSPHCSGANTFSFCSEKIERKKGEEKELVCALSPAPAVPFPGFLSALTLLYSAYFLHVHLNSKSCLLSPPLSLSLFLSLSLSLTAHLCVSASLTLSLSLRGRGLK